MPQFINSWTRYFAEISSVVCWVSALHATCNCLEFRAADILQAEKPPGAEFTVFAVSVHLLPVYNNDF